MTLKRELGRDVSKAVAIMVLMTQVANKERIATFDILRGYFLFVILIDHSGRFFGFWELFTGRGGQWVSAAEGFFFLSGVMIGMVRGRKMINNKIVDVIKKCWSRALTIYLWAIGLTILFSAIAAILPHNPGLKPGIFSNGGFSNFVKDTLDLKFSYGWADFLRYYAVYLFVAPGVIWLIRKKLWHTALIISLVVWLETETIMGSWQLLFFSGVVAGFYREQIESFFTKLSDKVKKTLVVTVYMATTLTLAASIFFTTIADEFGKPEKSKIFLGLNLGEVRAYSIDTLQPIFDKNSLAPARLILFYLWFTAMFLLVRKFEEPIKRYLGWLLITLGKNSLYVYIVHSIILYALNMLIPFGQFWVINIIINTAFVLIVWWMTKKKFLFRFIPR